MASSPDPDPTTDPAPPRVLLVCHAGPELGIGHLTRMLAVADALDRIGLKPQLLAQGEAVVRADLDRFVHTFVGLESDLSEAVVAAATDSAVDAVVFDIHPRLVPAAAATLLETLRNAGRRLVAVDGMFDLCEMLDAVWIPSFAVDPALLQACTGRIHHGWDSYLNRRRLPVQEWRPGNRVLALSGGSDVTGQAGTLPPLLEATIPAGTEVHWVQGPFAPAPAIPGEGRLEWTVHESPQGLDELIVAADYALTVFGVSLFEVLQYGVPTVVYSPYTDDVQPELGLLAGEGVAVVAEDAAAAATTLALLMDDTPHAESLARAARDRLDGGGPDRLAALIHSLV